MNRSAHRTAAHKRSLPGTHRGRMSRQRVAVRTGTSWTAVLSLLIGLMAAFMLPSSAVEEPTPTPAAATDTSDPSGDAGQKSDDGDPADPATTEPEDEEPSEPADEPSGEPTEEPSDPETNTDPEETEPSPPEGKRSDVVPNAAIGPTSTTPGDSEIRQNNTFYAYVGAGENIDLAFAKVGPIANSVGVTVTVRGPGGVTETCSRPTGAPNGSGCFWANLTSGTPGIWEITFTKDVQGAVSSELYNWTINVQGGATTIPGRVYSERYVMFQGVQPTDATNVSLWYQSELGYQYGANYGGYNGVDSVFTADATGVRYDGTCTSAYASIEIGDPNRSIAAPGECGDPYKIFFEAPSPSLPASATMWDGTTQWLAPPIAPDPTITDLTFTPDSPRTRSGDIDFTVSSNFTGQVVVEIDTDNDGTYDRTIPASAVNGSGSVAFDGLDANGNAVPATQDMAVRVTIRQIGEIHFTQTDVERRAGGVEVTRLNGPGAGARTLYWNDTGLSTTTKCGTRPVPLDGRAGINSTGGVHRWDPSVVGCPNQLLGWGDGRYIDDWTFRSINESEQIEIPGAPLPPWECGTNAPGLLFQSDNDPASSLYSIDLVTGDYPTPAPVLDGVVNSTGYNVLDDYVYGLSGGELVRIGSDGSIDPLGIPLTGGSVVGDVDDEGHYWNYNPATGHWIDVDIAAGTSTSGTAVSPAPTVGGQDWAYVPGTNKLWRVARDAAGTESYLVGFDRTTHTWTSPVSLGNLGGPDSINTVGAVFADADGFLYASYNYTGAIYRIDVSAGTATPFADGPSSAGNDGARCPTPILTDFGDAPDSYGTSLADDGPRHGIKNYDETTGEAPLMLGASIDSETDGQPGAAADGDGGDEDGVAGQIVMVVGQPTDVDVVVTNNTNEPATLVGWIDVNDDGVFDDSERQSVVVQPGGTTTQTLTFPAPTGPGDGTYARFRLFPGNVPAAEQLPTGPASAGEVEDYPVVGPIPVEIECPNVYAAQGSSPHNFYLMDTATGDMTSVGALDLGAGTNNALGFSADGRYLFSYLSGSPGDVIRYDTFTGDVDEWTGSINGATHGAVDPDTGIYYYGTVSAGGGSVYAFDTNTETNLGQVATISWDIAAAGGNGDWTFDSEGNLYVVAGDAPTNPLYVISDSLPTTAQATPVPVTGNQLAVIAGGPDAINGVAFDGDGYLFLASNQDVHQVHPSSGQVVNSEALSPSGQSVDLGSCATPATITVQKDVVGRMAPGDQFEVSVTGGGISANNTGTTTGTDTGLQTDDAEVAGLVLGLPGTEYTIAESGANGADLGSYDTTWECVDTANGDDVIADGTGAQGTFTMPDSVDGIGSAIVCTITNDPIPLDFGDAPNSYGTNLGADGPRHVIVDGMHLGATIDSETNGQPTPAADGDGADEDGVAGPIEITTGDPATVTVSATNDTNEPATLVGWIDLNGDGVFGNGAERVLITVPANSGTADYLVTFPGGTVTADTFARFRLFAGDIAPADALPTGPAAGGEVEDYPVVVLDRELEITKTSDATADSRPGDVITYEVTAENTGAGDYTAANPARVWDDLSGVLDDATYNGNAAADRDPATPTYANPIITWEGALPAGDTVTITYTVTLKGGGDGTVRNVAFAQCDTDDPDCDPVTPECDPPVGGIDPDTGKACDEEEFELPKLAIRKAANRTDLPAVGETVTYTVTVTNPGPGDYTAAEPGTISDDLTEVLDDATFVSGSITSPVGTADFTDPNLTWTGVLTAGQSATITYDVTYTGGGDQQLTNNACVPVEEAQDPQDPCAVVEVPGSGLDRDKVADPASGTAVEVGEEVTYTLRFDNTGQAPAAVDTFDDLSGVLDDAEFVVGSINADGGLTATYDAAGERVDVAGTVPVGGSLEVTYTVRVLAWADQGDHVLRNALQCQAGDPPDCEPDITEHPVRALDIEKTSDRTADTEIGDTVTYTVTGENIGEADYTATDPARVWDDLTGVLDDATYDGNAETDPAGVGTITYTQPIIQWVGELAQGDTITLTYTVTLTGAGDLNVRNVAFGACDPADPDCDNTTPECDPPTDEGVDPDTGQVCDEEEFGLPDIEDSKSVDPADRTAVAAGEELTYTLTFTNNGTVAGAVSKDDSLAMLLDDAEIISGPDSSDPAALTATLNGELIEVRGTLGAGDTVTITYTVRVKSDADRVADGADDMLGNFLIEPGTTPPTECEPEADEDTTCNPVSRIVDEKSVDPADRTAVKAGDELTYTLTFENLGNGAGDVEKDDYLGMLLDDATIISGPDVAGQGNLTATRNGDMIEVRGTLGAGDVATVTYTVRVKSDADRVADGADNMLGNFLIEPGTTPPTECEPEADEDSTCNPVSRIVDEKSVDPADRTAVKAGDELTYTLTFENLGNGAGDVEKDDYLGMLLDDAEIISGPDTSDPALTATVNADFIEIRGTLGAGDTVTVTYTVRVKSDADRVADGADDMLGNFLIEPGTPPPTDCEPEADEDSTCNPVSRIVDEKSVDPADRTSVDAGDELTYTLTFENLGQGAGDVEKDDYIGMLLDDAVIISGPTVAGQGNLTATLSGERIEIRGTLGAGDVATVTYTVRVKPDAARVADGGDDMLGNFLIDPDEDPPTECEPEADEDSTCNPVSRIVDEKSVDPADRTSVKAGDELTYTLTFENLGQGGGPVSKDDYIGMLLDDATIISGPDVAGDGNLTATRNGDVIEIRGRLGAGDVATVTYTVQVKSDADRVADGADDMLGNFLIEPGTTPPTECEPEADEDSTCNPVSRIVDEKSVDPADRTTVAAGDELTYTLTFENLGNGAGEVEKDDYLGMLLDDAEIISGPTVAGSGLTATLNGDFIEVRGTLGAGDIVTVTYTVRVKTDADRKADGADNMLGNFLIEPGTTPPTDCEPEADEDSTCNPVRELDIEKSSDRTADTKIGDTVTYTVTAQNVGNGDYTTADPAVVRDTLAGVLDDADYNNNAAADRPGNLSYSAPVIEWTGALAVDDVVTMTYTVTLKAGGDLMVRNVAWGNGGDPVECDPPTAEGFDPDTGKPCDEVEFGLPDIVDNKMVDPKKGSTVVSGQTLTYTLTFTNNGTAPGNVDKVDNLEQILDDAKIVTAPASSDPALTVSAISGGEFTIKGTLQPDQTVTVTYVVEVKKPANLGDKFLGNYLLEPGTTPPTPEECLAQMDEDSTCNPVSDIKPKKTVDPKDGSNVNGGDELTYTLTFTNTGKGAGEVEYVDKMAGILDDATLIKGPKSSDGAITATLKDGKIKISGTLAGGETVTVTYTVRVKAYGDQGDHVLENFLVPPGISNERCANGDPLCTKNPIPPPADPPSDPSDPPGIIPNTGGPAFWALVAGLALLIGGGLFLYMSRRRRGQETDGEASSFAEVDTA